MIEFVFIVACGIKVYALNIDTTCKEIKQNIVCTDGNPPECYKVKLEEEE